MSKGWRLFLGVVPAFFLFSVVGGPADLRSDVGSLLRELQRAARSGDSQAFINRCSPNLQLSMWYGGRSQTTSRSAADTARMLCTEQPMIANPFRASENLSTNIISIERLPSGAYKVRVKYMWRLQITAGMGNVLTKSKFWHVGDLLVMQAGSGFRLSGMDFLPADFHQKVLADVLRLYSGGQRDESVLLARHNGLFDGFLSSQPGYKLDIETGKWIRRQGLPPYREEPNPAPQLLPERNVTPQIRQNRERTEDVIIRSFPEMRGKVLFEEIKQFDGIQYFFRIYRRMLNFIHQNREYTFQVNLRFSFDGNGKMHYSLLPDIRSREPLPQPEKKPMEKQLLLPRPQPESKSCLVLTNLERLRANHPQNYGQIHDYIAAFGPILDTASAGIDPADWRAVDRWLEGRFDPNQYDCLFIFGNHDVVPFVSYPNPSYSETGRTVDDDRIIYSDDGYADFDHDPHQAWDIMLARMPDDRGIIQDKNSVLYRPIPADEKPAYRHFAVYGNAKWPVSEEMASLGNPGSPKLIWSEPYRDTSFPSGFFQGSNLFINLHGNDSLRPFYAGEMTQTRDKVCVNALNIDQAVAPGALIMATCCWGASIFKDGRPKTSDESIALRFLRNGARAYMGNTKKGWICPEDPQMDYHIALWMELFKGHLDKGEIPQKAFMLSKRDFARSLNRIRGDTRATQEKSYHQMVYLGLPPLRYREAGPEKKIPWGEGTDEEQIKALILRRHQNFSHENLAGYLEDLAVDSPKRQWESTGLPTDYWPNHNITITLESLEILELDQSTSRIRTVEKHKGTGPVGQVDMILRMEFQLRKIGGRWKIYDYKSSY